MAEEDLDNAKDELDYWDYFLSLANSDKYKSRDDRIIGTRELLLDLALFLEGKSIPFRGVFQSKEVRELLAQRIRDSLDKPVDEVGDALGLGIPKPKKRKSKHAQDHHEFITWYREQQETKGLLPAEQISSSLIMQWLDGKSIDVTTLRKWESKHLASSASLEDASHLFSPAKN